MQDGSVIRRNRKKHPDIWQFRWREKTSDGKRIYRRRQIGTVDQIPDMETARKAARLLVPDLNARVAKSKSVSMTVAQLCSHFEQCELSLANTWRSYSTKTIYKVYLKRWIIPRWSEYLLSDIRTIEVESWLLSLPIARSTCAKIRKVISVLFNHACRYEFFTRCGDVFGLPFPGNAETIHKDAALGRFWVQTGCKMHPISLIYLRQVIP